MKFTEEGLPAIPVNVEGKSEMFVVDTGGVYSMLRSDIVDEMKLRQELAPPFMFQAVNGITLTRIAMAASLAIGPLSEKHASLLVLPAHQKYLSSDSFGGTIAPDILQNYDADFDFGGGKFSLFSPDHCPGRVVYWTTGGFGVVPFETDLTKHIRVALVLNGRNIVALLDTGSTSSIMPLEAATKLFGTDPDFSAQLAQIPSGNATAVFKRLAFGAVEVSEPPIELFAGKLPGIGSDSNVQMILGMKELSRLHLFIAYHEKNLYVTPADAH